MLVHLTLTDGRTLRVKPSTINFIEPSREQGGSAIVTLTGERVEHVRQSPDQVEAAIALASK